MALATQCPHCQTTFRVVHDQLKLRAGLVRCGHCKEIFNGIEHLLPATPAATKDIVTSPAAAAPANDQFASAEKTISSSSSSLSSPTQHGIDVDGESAADTRSGAAISDKAASEAAVRDTTISTTAIDDTSVVPADDTIYSHAEIEETPSQDPLQRMTLMDFTRELPDEFDSDIDNDADSAADKEIGDAEGEENISFDSQVHDELDAAIEDLQRKPWRKVKRNAKPSARSSVDMDEDEPGFVKRGRRQQRLGKKLRLFFALSSLLLFIAALAQGVYIFRNQIAGMYPQTKPVLIQMCDLLACRIKLPAQIALLSIESSELQAVSTGKDTFVLSTLLRNKGRTSQEWPNIELTLNNNDEKPLLRRVFKATDYISKPTDIALGILPGSERSVKLTFSLSQIKASGYRVYLFYP